MKFIGTLALLVAALSTGLSVYLWQDLQALKSANQQPKENWLGNPHYQFGRKLVFSTPEGDTQNSGSVFTGWGSSFQVINPFDTLSLSLHSWDKNKPVTQIRVNIRKAHAEGEVIASKTLNHFDIHQMSTVDFRFGQVIATTDPLWIEFLTDGHIVTKGTLKPSDKTFAPTRYSTAGRLDETLTATVPKPIRIVFTTNFYRSQAGDMTLSQEGQHYLQQQGSLYFKKNDAPRINLPDRIYGRVGHPLQLFWRGIVEAVDPYQYDIRTEFEYPRRGYNYPRYYEIDTSSAYSAQLKVEVRDNVGNILSRDSTQIIVREKPQELEKPRNILVVGDSLTAGGEWVQEFNRLLGLKRVRFVGDKGGDEESGVAEGQHAVKWVGNNGKNWRWYAFPSRNVVKVTPDKHYDLPRSLKDSLWQDEAGNQFAVKAYYDSGLFFEVRRLVGPVLAKGKLTLLNPPEQPQQIRYNQLKPEPVNPFWHYPTQKLSFQQFATANGIEQIDDVYILLAWNQIKSGKPKPQDHDELINHATRFLRQLRRDYPEVKVKILGPQLPSLNGGLAHNYKNDPEKNTTFAMVRSVFGLNLAFEQFCQSEEFANMCEFLDVATQVDSEYNMPFAEFPVNQRSDLKEVRGINGLHPSLAGYMQIADVAYRGFD